MLEIERWIQQNPQMDDKLERRQIVALLECIPLGYRTEQEHEKLEQFVERAQSWFRVVDTNFEPSND
jgi:hypothetical protein